MRRTLAEKQQLVADILQIPRDHFEHIADMAAEPGGEKDARELILNSILSGKSSSSTPYSAVKTRPQLHPQR